MTLKGETILELYIEDTGTEDSKKENILIDGAGLGWPVVLASMIGFLEEFYGYPFAQEIAIRRNPVRLHSGWKGQFFGIATDEEIAMARALEEDDGQMNLDFGDHDD